MLQRRKGVKNKFADQHRGEGAYYGTVGGGLARLVNHEVAQPNGDGTSSRLSAGPLLYSSLICAAAPSLPPRPPFTMSVLIETSLGELVIDLLIDEAPKCCEK